MEAAQMMAETASNGANAVKKFAEAGAVGGLI
jgi:hypothetical protein